jgi:hypothetical protein
MELDRIDCQKINEDYIYRVVRPSPLAVGRSDRAGKIKSFPESDRTFHGLQALSQKDPTMEFCVWWELLHNEAENREAIKQGKAELRVEKARKKQVQLELQKEIIAQRLKKKQQNTAPQNPPTPRVESRQARKRAPIKKRKS